MLKNDILLELKNEKPGIPVSGQKLAEKFGVTRNAIWKAVKSLQNDGFQITSDGRKGYVLKGGADFLSATEIFAWMTQNRQESSDPFLQNSVKGAGHCPAFREEDILIQTEVSSTNSEARSLLESGKKAPFLVLAERQTAGRGHNGSAFPSPASEGLYMTLALPLHLSVNDSILVSKAAAVAVIQALAVSDPDLRCLADGKETPSDSHTPDSMKKMESVLTIHGINSIYAGAKKICGILTEASAMDLESGCFSVALIGIGIYLRDTSVRNRLAALITDYMVNIDFSHPEEMLAQYDRYHV